MKKKENGKQIGHKINKAKRTFFLRNTNQEYESGMHSHLHVCKIY